MESENQKKFAVITGASSGIGLELAKQFAQNDFDLLICSGSEDIFTAQDELEQYGTVVDAVQVNLSTFNGGEELYDAIKAKKRPVDALVLNAGVGVGGEFSETSLKEEISMINLNAVSPVHLTKRLLPMMYAQGQGRILFTSSITAVIPAPFEAVYGATKAFISSFAEAIRNESKKYGVTVTILMPGPTNTNFFKRADMEGTKVGDKLKYDNDPSEVAAQGYRALMSGKEKVISESFKTKLQGVIAGFLPDKVKVQMHRHISEPRH